jgi:hypothetical protein
MTEQKQEKPSKKKYYKPEIAKVELVPEQVVLDNCRTSTTSNRATGSHCKWGGANQCYVWA